MFCEICFLPKDNPDGILPVGQRNEIRENQRHLRHLRSKTGLLRATALATDAKLSAIKLA
jgi:hypothetical protein